MDWPEESAVVQKTEAEKKRSGKVVYRQQQKRVSVSQEIVGPKYPEKHQEKLAISEEILPVWTLKDAVQVRGGHFSNHYLLKYMECVWEREERVI